MRSKPEILEKRADECRRRAATATDRQLKALFLNLTQQWNEIAHIGRMLAEDALTLHPLLQRL